MSKRKKLMFRGMIERKRIEAKTDDERAKYDKILRETNGKLAFK